MGITGLLIISFILLPFADRVALITFEATPLQFLIGLLTHQVGHANIHHLLGNFIFVYPYALYVEQQLGVKRFLQLFFLTGIFAALLHITTFGLHTGLIGSSGADFGIMGAACALFGGKKEWTKWVGLGCFFAALYWQASVLLASTFAGVATLAHIGGLISGYVLIKSLHRDRPKKNP